uniref:Uncharacterized protein n=1 Tax=Cacopsylla melanoneura TaxID=428564 RepID=A0A8D9EBA6_9HEMI
MSGIKDDDKIKDEDKIKSEDDSKDEDKDLPNEKICERCSVVLAKPTFRSSSGHEICSPCHDTEALLERNLEIETDSDEESVGDSEEEYEDAIGLEEGYGEDREKTGEEIENTNLGRRVCYIKKIKIRNGRKHDLFSIFSILPTFNEIFL